jgi:hypothetical protein
LSFSVFADGRPVMVMIVSTVASSIFNAAYTRRCAVSSD